MSSKCVIVETCWWWLLLLLLLLCSFTFVCAFWGSVVLNPVDISKQVYLILQCNSIHLLTFFSSEQDHSCWIQSRGCLYDICLSHVDWRFKLKSLGNNSPNTICHTCSDRRYRASTAVWYYFQCRIVYHQNLLNFTFW